MIEPIADIVHTGGWVVLAIAAASALAWALIIRQWLKLREEAEADRRAMQQMMHDLDARGRVGERGGVGGGRLLSDQLRLSGLTGEAHDRASFEAQVLPLVRSEATLLARPLRTVAVLAASLPLLGLLGTVLGMMDSFAAITGRGAADIDVLAGGISQALITTQAGLIMAVPIVLMHGVLRSRLRRHIDAMQTLVKKIETRVCYD